MNTKVRNESDSNETNKNVRNRTVSHQSNRERHAAGDAQSFCIKRNREKQREKDREIKFSLS